MRHRRRRSPLLLERLEDRCVPATFGNAWPDAAHLTLSFVPDQTPIGNHPSQLIKTLNAQYQTTNPAVWEQVVLRAFQTWAVNANINIGVTGDGGQALGASGAPQGDGRFGDIRISGFAMDANSLADGGDTVAFAEPFDPAAGTSAGDVSFNLADRFGNGTAGTYDLFTVALHEAGHALGLGHSADPSSVMYEGYTGPRTGLSAGDIANLQALYGPRTNSGGGLVAAGLLTNLVPVNGQISQYGEQDRYSVLLGTSVLGATVQLHTSGISALLAKVTVTDLFGRTMTATATNALNGDLSVHLNALQANLPFSIKVEGAPNSGVFGLGTYQLQVVPDGLVGGVADLLANVDYGLNDTLATALPITQTILNTDQRFDYTYKASISSPSDVDYYSIKSPTPAPGTQNVLTAMVWGVDPGKLDPVVSVYDASQNPVPFTVLVRENGTMVIQIAGQPGNATFYVKVQAANPGGPSGIGNYFLGVDFGAQATNLQTITSGTAATTPGAATFTITATHDVLAHFVLSAGTGSADAAVKMDVFDQNGNLVYSLMAAANDARSVTLFLAQGKYSLRFTTVSLSGNPVAPLSYVLRGLSLSDRIASYSSNTTFTTSAPAGGGGADPSNGGSQYAGWGDPSNDGSGMSW